MAKERRFRLHFISWFGIALAACAIALTPAISYAQENKPEVILRVTAEELTIISDGLQTQPFGKVVPLINKLQGQVMAQQPKPVVPVPPVAETKPTETPKE